jgi:hypothetical protein
MLERTADLGKAGRERLNTSPQTTPSQMVSARRRKGCASHPPSASPLISAVTAPFGSIESQIRPAGTPGKRFRFPGHGRDQQKEPCHLLFQVSLGFGFGAMVPSLRRWTVPIHRRLGTGPAGDTPVPRPKPPAVNARPRGPKALRVMSYSADTRMIGRIAAGRPADCPLAGAASRCTHTPEAV